MYIKRFFIPSIIGLSMLSSGVIAAEPAPKAAPKAISTCMEAKGGCKHNRHMTAEQRAQVNKIIEAYRSKIRPLRQQARVLRLQIQGKLVTKGTHWKDIAMLNEQLNKLKGDMSTMRLRARLEIFQKTGVLIPGKAKQRKFKYLQQKHHHSH